MKNYFLVYLWAQGDMAYFFYTETELINLHRVFGSLSVHSFYNLLRSRKGEKMSDAVKQTLEEISKMCTICVSNASKPRRFKITVGMDEVLLNHIVFMDVMYLMGLPVLHVVHEAIHFN